jgi:hypothetical protein
MREVLLQQAQSAGAMAGAGCHDLRQHSDTLLATPYLNPYAELRAKCVVAMCCHVVCRGLCAFPKLRRASDGQVLLASTRQYCELKTDRMQQQGWQ